MGAIIAIEDVRAEGLTTDDADDPRVELAIALAETYVEQVTQQFFDARELTLKLNGNDRATLQLQYPLLTGDDAVTSITVDDAALDLANVVIYNRTTPDDRRLPRIVRKDADWPEGHQNVVVVGTFGYVDRVETPAEEPEDPDDDPGDPVVTYVAPGPVKRATVALAMRLAAELGDDAAQKEARGHLLTGETTKNRSMSWALQAVETGGLTGAREIDLALSMYRRAPLV